MQNEQQDGILFTKDVLDEIKSGRKVQAIKLLRHNSGLGLKEAKESIEAYIENNAEVKEAFDSTRSSGLSQENILHIIILLVVLLAVYVWI
jgi:ribosomal protein L7/L12